MAQDEHLPFREAINTGELGGHKTPRLGAKGTGCPVPLAMASSGQRGFVPLPRGRGRAASSRNRVREQPREGVMSPCSWGLVWSETSSGYEPRVPIHNGRRCAEVGLFLVEQRSVLQ